MPKRNPQPMPQTADIPSPLRGLDTSSSFTDQRPGTTPVALNVRPFDCRSSRRRLSRRPGLSKWLDDPLASASVQELNQVAAAVDETPPVGDLLSAASVGDKVSVYNAAGAVTATSAALTGTQSLGTVDDLGDWYVATVKTDGSQVRVSKFSRSDGSESWHVDMAVTGTGTGAKLWGLAAFDGTVYVWVIDSAEPGIYRFQTSDGARRDLMAWLTTNDGLVSATATAVRSYQAMSVSAGQLFVCGGKSSKLILQNIDTTTGAFSHATTLQDPFAHYECRVVSDQGANAYVLTNAGSSGNNKLIKVNFAGTVVFTVTSTGNGAKDICYEPTTFAIGVVGTAIFANIAGAGADDSFQQFGAVDGLLYNHGKPDTIATWLTICADGLGGLRLRRSAASGHDLIQLEADGSPLGFADSTALGTTSEFLWVQCTGSNLNPLNTGMRPSRIVRAIGVAGGGLYSFTRAGKELISAAFVSGAAPVVFSTMLNQVLYFVDGFSYRTYDARTNSAGTLTATAGSLPLDTRGRGATLAASYRGRLVLAGPDHNWYMSRVDDPTDWDTDPLDPTSSDPVSGITSPAGLCPDKINCVLAWGEDELIFGCDRSIWRMAGDPADNGRFELVTNVTGMAWGRPFCTDADGNLYFLGSRGVLYRMRPRGRPEEISGPVGDRLRRTNLNTRIARMVWDDQWNGFHLLLSTISGSGSALHYWWDAGVETMTPAGARSTSSWWSDRFGNTAHNALAVHVFDGDDPNDRRVLLGGRDGFVRFLDNDAEDDDGTPIASEVMVGPLQTPDGRAMRLQDLQATLGYQSPDVTYDVHPGESAEAAVYASSRRQGTFSLGRNHSQAVRVRGHCIYVKLSSALTRAAWTLDDLKAVFTILPAGVAQRQFNPTTVVLTEEDDDSGPPPEPPAEPPAPGDPFTPAVADPPYRLWIYGDDVSLSGLADAASIITWTNRGAAGGVVWDDGGLLTQPKYKTGILNGLPIARFNGTDQCLTGDLPESEYWAIASKTWFVVAKGNSNATLDNKGFMTDSATFVGLFQRETPGPVVGFVNWDGNYDVPEVSCTLNQWMILTGWHGTGRLGLQVNGDSYQEIDSGPTQFLTGRWYLGRIHGTGYLECDVAEVIITNRLLDDAERKKVQGYLAWKWSLVSVLPAGHPYKAAAPTT